MLLKRLKSLAINAVPNRGVKHSLANILHHKNLLIVITFREKGWRQEGDDKQEMAFDFHVFNPLYSEFHNSEQVILFGKKKKTKQAGIICRKVLEATVAIYSLKMSTLKMNSIKFTFQTLTRNFPFFRI